MHMAVRNVCALSLTEAENQGLTTESMEVDNFDSSDSGIIICYNLSIINASIWLTIVTLIRTCV